MDNMNKNALKRRYNIIILILVAILILCVLWCTFYPSALGFLMLPCSGIVNAMLLWYAIVRMCFLRRPERFLQKEFMKALKWAFIPPVWILSTIVLMAIPVANSATWNEDLASASALLLVILGFPIFLILGVISSAYALLKAIQHRKKTSVEENIFYRTGPLVFSGIAIIAFGVSFAVLLGLGLF